MGSLALGVVAGGADAGEGVDASVPEPVAGPFEGEDVGVVHDAVDHCCSYRGVSEKMHQFAEVIPDQDAVVIADPA